MSKIEDFTPLWGVWQVDGLIGEGSFGKVYKAVRKDFGKEYFCAVKHISIPHNNAEIEQFMHENMSNDSEAARDYFEQIVKDVTDEISIMYSLKGNTNLVSYEEHMVIPKAEGIGYDILIKMELLTNLSVKVSGGAFTEQDAIRLGIDICTSLEMCAEKNLIHRDIKPQNIFINDEGRYKLGDFGISRKLEKTSSGLSKKGTYSYMAPEVYKGGEYGANVDIYSLGLVLYRLLNGNRMPFLPLAPNPVRYDDNEKALRRRIMGDEIPAPAFASPELADIVLKMCAYDRNRRYKTATETKQELLKVVNTADKVMPMVASVGSGALTQDSSAPAPAVAAAPAPIEEVSAASEPLPAGSLSAPPSAAETEQANHLEATVSAFKGPLVIPPKPAEEPNRGPSAEEIKKQKIKYTVGFIVSTLAVIPMYLCWFSWDTLSDVLNSAYGRTNLFWNLFQDYFVFQNFVATLLFLLGFVGALASALCLFRLLALRWAQNRFVRTEITNQKRSAPYAVLGTIAYTAYFLLYIAAILGKIGWLLDDRFPSSLLVAVGVAVLLWARSNRKKNNCNSLDKPYLTAVSTGLATVIVAVPGIIGDLAYWKPVGIVSAVICTVSTIVLITVLRPYNVRK